MWTQRVLVDPFRNRPHDPNPEWHLPPFDAGSSTTRIAVAGAATLRELQAEAPPKSMRLYNDFSFGYGSRFRYS